MCGARVALPDAVFTRGRPNSYINFTIHFEGCARKIGAIFPNEKRNENDADMSGNLETKSGPMKVWGRKKQSKNGNDYTAISLAPPLDAPKQSPMESDAANQIPSSRLEDDEIPF